MLLKAKEFEPTNSRYQQIVQPPLVIPTAFFQKTLYF